MRRRGMLQTTTDDDDIRQRAILYWPAYTMCRRASNKRMTTYSVHADRFAGVPAVSASRSASSGAVLLAVDRWRHKLGLAYHQSRLSPVPVVNHWLTTTHLAGRLTLAAVNRNTYTMDRGAGSSVKGDPPAVWFKLCIFCQFQFQLSYQSKFSV